MKHSWQRKRARTLHLDDWLITYADMITLLLCFFVVFLIIALSQKNPPPAAPTPPVTVEAPVPIIMPVEQPLVIRGNLPFYDSQMEADPESVAEPIVEPEKPVTVEPPPASAVEKQGDRITRIEMNSAAFFDPGSATLSEAGAIILQSLAADLKADMYKEYEITVEGHTDDTPIETAQFPSNWELSTARASAVVRYLLTQGLAAEKLRAAGYADTLPKLPNRDTAGLPIAENQAQNRRVVVRLEKIEKS